MSEVLKIAIIGDYNFTFNAHHATNLSLDHSSEFLEVELNYYWIKISEALKHKEGYFQQYDGIWVAPGPIENPFYLNGIFKKIANKNIPVLITGEGFKIFLEYLITQNQLLSQQEKLISENLVSGNSFERITIEPRSKAFQQLYKNFNTTELSSSRYSLYPQLVEQLELGLVDIEAVNHFEDPEIISLRKSDFFVSCAFCPQISSTRDIPHPIIYTFLKMCDKTKKSNLD
jgi:CTP synthase (UTP-ammonia lyase)